VFSFMRWFFKNTEQFDVVHYPRPKLYPFFWKLKTKKTVVTFHDAPEKGSPRFRTAANYFWEWSVKLWFHRYVDAAIGVSQFSADGIADYYHIPHHKTYAVYNGGSEGYAPFGEQERANGQARLASQYKIRSPYVLQVSRLVPHKNAHRQIEAFGILKKKYNLPHSLVIMGGGSSHDPLYEQMVRRAVEQSGYADDIIVAPYIETSDLNMLYACSAVTLMAPTSEGFGIPLVEAMASGAPIVTSNRSSLPEIVGDAGTLVDPFNPESISEGVAAVVRDQEKTADMVRRGLSRAKQYTWSASAQETVKLYQSLFF